MMVCDYSCVVWCDSLGGSFVQDVAGIEFTANICPHMHNTMLDHLWQLAGVWNLWITSNLTYCIPTCNEWFSAHLSPTCTTWCLAIYGMWLWTVMSWADQPNIPLAISLLFTFSSSLLQPNILALPKHYLCSEGCCFVALHLYQRSCRAWARNPTTCWVLRFYTSTVHCDRLCLIPCAQCTQSQGMKITSQKFDVQFCDTLLAPTCSGWCFWNVTASNKLLKVFSVQKSIFCTNSLQHTYCEEIIFTDLRAALCYYINKNLMMYTVNIRS